MAQGLTLLNRYEIHGQLGTGGTSDVVRAFDTRMERDVAIKRLPNNPHMAPRALREARTLALLNHPNIVSVYDFIEEDNYFYLIMEVVEGRTLAELLPDRPLPLQTALGTALQVSAALEYAHANEIVHRDIKPANIMLQRTGRVKILDFGIARLQRQSKVTEDGQLVGTIGYLSPEQAEAGVIDDRTDLFLFAILLYRMLTGTDPFTAETAGGVIYKIIHIDPAHPSDINPEVPRALGDAVMTALEKHPDDRWGSVTEFRYKLERHLAAGAPEAAARPLYEGRLDEPYDAAGPTRAGGISHSEKAPFSLNLKSMWAPDVGRAESPASAALAALLVFASLTKAFGFSPLLILPAVLAGALAYLRPNFGMVAVLLSLLVAATMTSGWLLLIGLPFVALYVLIWRHESGYAPMLPFTAPLMANVGATSGFGLGLLFPFVAGYTLAPLQAALAAVLAGFLLEGYDLLYMSDLRFLQVPGPHLAEGLAGPLTATEFLIQLSSPYATNPFLLLQPFLLGAIAFIVSSFRARLLKAQAVVAVTAALFLLFGFSFFLSLSPDQGPAFQGLVKQIIAIAPVVAVLILVRGAILAIKNRSRNNTEAFEE